MYLQFSLDCFVQLPAQNKLSLRNDWKSSTYDLPHLQGYVNGIRKGKWEDTEEHQRLHLFIQ